MTQEPAPFIQFDDFLRVDDVDALLGFVDRNETQLRPSGVLVANEGETPEQIRQSQTLFDISEIWPFFETPLTNLLPLMRSELGIGHFTLDHIERQLAVHFDGDFFAPHNDSGSPEVATRRLTYVYYFNREPKQYSGGELRLYHSVDDQGAKLQGTEFETIEPRHNSIVFFPSWVHHEVLPVSCAVPGLDGSRMTVTGWYHQPVSTRAVDLHTRTEMQRSLLPFFTETGFEIVDTPPEVHERLYQAFVAGRSQAVEEPADTTVLPDGEPELVPIDDLAAWVGEKLRPMHERFSGQSLEHTTTYGIRSYGPGQTLVRHCDRLHTHVVSSVVHLAHDGSRWPLVIEDHDGQAHEVVLEPGQMLLYESASCPHGRPQPFDGTHYASVFVHYRPQSGWEIDEAALFAAARPSPQG